MNGHEAETIREIATAFQKSRIFLTAYELGIFTFLGDTAQRSEDIAERLGADPRATDRLLNALCAIGLVEKSNNTFSNTPAAARFLVAGTSDYLAGFMHTVHLWDTWSTLTDAVREGTIVAGRTTGDRWLSAFIAAMHDRGMKQAPASIAGLDLTGVTRVLDVGGGSGAYAVAFVRSGQGIRATVVDLPSVIPLTRSYVDKEGLLDRIEFREGDYKRDSLGSGYDIAFLSAVVHSNSDAENRALLVKCAASVLPGGQVVVQDFIMDPDRTSPAHGTFFALNMLVGTAEGDTYTEAEIRGWMEEAGLVEIKRINTPFQATQIVGRRRKTGDEPSRGRN